MLEEESSIDSLIETLKLAKQVGFSSSSSPIGFLLEAGTDVCLQISSLLEKGTRARRNNPEVKFNYKVSDPLGNPKSFKIYQDPKTFWDPALAKVFRELASFFVLVKRDDKSALDFMSEVVVPSKTSSEESSEQNEKEQKIQLDIAKIANLAYHRRQRKKRSFSKHS
jgi:hypothetical protein